MVTYLIEIPDRIKELAELIEKGYRNMSIINSEDKDIKSISPVYDKIDADYRQFGYNLKMPQWIFEGNADNRLIASEYANGLQHAEFNYLIKKMEDSQKSEKMYLIKEIVQKQLSEHVSSLENATDLFIPLKVWCSKDFRYCDNFKQKFDDGQTYIRIGSIKLRVHLSNKFMPFDKIFILDRSGIKWSQKKVKDMGVSRAHDPKGLKLLTSEDNILQISAKKNEDNSVQFLIRLLAGAIIDSEKVRIINISKKCLEKDLN